MGKTILGAFALLLVLVAVWLFYNPRQSTRSGGTSAAFAAFKDAAFDKAARVTLQKGKSTVELKKAGPKWVVASTYGYPADGEKVEKILKALGEIEHGEARGREAKAHDEYGVDA